MTAPAAKPPLKGSDRHYLRAIAHHLRPVVHIGKTGLTPRVLAAIDEALDHHELIKVRFQDYKAQKRELAQTITQASASEMIGAIGHVYMFYRQHSDPDKRTIPLPLH